MTFALIILVTISGVASLVETPDMRLCVEAAESYETIYTQLVDKVPCWVVNSAYRTLAKEEELKGPGAVGWHRSGRGVDISTDGLAPAHIALIIRTFKAAGWQFEPGNTHLHFEFEEPGKTAEEAAIK